MAVRSRSKRSRRRVAAADLISDLDDDVLVRVLELLPDTRHAVRTATLSRRWRDLWTRVPTLRFKIAPTFVDNGIERRCKGSAEAIRFLSFVNNALTRRAQTDAAAAALEHLAISFVVDPSVVGQQAKTLAPQCIKASQEWVWYGMRSGVKSFVLELSVPLRYYRRCISREGGRKRKQPMMDLSELPSSAKLETMHWKLGSESLQLPATAVFTSLLDLSLESIVLPAGSDHLLARLLSSSCCPRLQKLQLSSLWLYELDELLVESTTLLELSCEGINGSGLALELKTPILQVLRIGDYTFIQLLRMSSPRLEELTFLLEHQPTRIDVDGELSCVRSLKIYLSSHTHDDEDNNNGSICLLQCCTSVTCLGVSLFVVQTEDRVRDTIRGRIPHLPHLVSLTVSVYLPELHCFGVGLADILTRCSNLKYLRVDCSNSRFLPQKLDCFCCDHFNHWKSHEMHLADIQEVEFNGLVGIECEGWFMRGVLRHAKQLQKATLSFDPWYELERIKSAFEIIPGGGGRWIPCDSNVLFYEWRPDL